MLTSVAPTNPNMSGVISELRNVHLIKADGTDEHKSSAKKDNCKEDETQRTCCQRIAWLCPSETIFKCISRTLTNSYDLLAILISLADVTTDVWVIYNYKVSGRQLFFDISLTAMIIAHLSYAIAVVARFKGLIWSHPFKHFCLFVISIPLTPFMSFIFFLISFDDNNCILKVLADFGFHDEFSWRRVTKRQASMLIWIRTKLSKHAGFIMEGVLFFLPFNFVCIHRETFHCLFVRLCVRVTTLIQLAVFEALPQSIIQLIAIVYYQDTELINVISICISLLSVATKTMVFSIAIDYRVFFFNWLSLMCDFFAIFAIVSWYVVLFVVVCMFFAI